MAASRGLDVLLRIVGNATSGINAINSTTSSLDKFKVGVGIAATAIAAFTAKLSSDAFDAFNKFDAGMRNVQSITLDTEEAFSSMTDQVLELTNSGLLAYADETAEVLYNVRSAGIDAGSAMATTNKILQTSAATLADQGDVAKVVTGLMNAYGEETVDAAKAGNLFVKTIQEGVTSGRELSQSFGNVSKLAASSGVSLESLTSAVALLTKSGIKTPEAITGIKATISSLIKPASETKELMEELGLSFSAAELKANDLTGMMQKIAEATKGDTDTLAKLIPSVEALNSVLVLTADGAQDFVDQTDRMNDSSTALADSLEKQQKSVTANVDKMKRSWNLFLIEIGKAVAEVFLPLIKAVTEAMQTFNAMDKELKKAYLTALLLVPVITAIGAAIAAVVTVGTPVIAFIGGLIVTFGQLAALLGSTTLALGIFTTALGVAVTALGVIGGAIFTVKKSFDALKAVIDFDKDITDFVKSTGNASAAITRLEKTQDKSIKQWKELALAYKTMSNRVVKGSKAQAELNLKYDVALRVIKNMEKETSNYTDAQENNNKATSTNTKLTDKQIRKLKELSELRNNLSSQLKQLTLSETDFKIFQIEKEFEADKKNIKAKGGNRADEVTAKKIHDAKISKLSTELAQDDFDIFINNQNDRDKARTKSINADLKKQNDGFKKSADLYNKDAKEKDKINKESTKLALQDFDAIIERQNDKSKSLKDSLNLDLKNQNDTLKKSAKLYNKDAKDYEQAEREKQRAIDATIRAIHILGSEMKESNNEMVQDAGELISELGEVGNAMQVIASGDVMGMLALGAQELGEAFNEITEATDELNDATADGNLTFEEMDSWVKKIISSIPLIGDLHLAFINMLEGVSESVTGVFSISTLKEAITNAEKNIDRLQAERVRETQKFYDKQEAAAKKGYENIKDFAKDAYDSQRDGLEQLVKDQEKAVDKLASKLKSVQDKLSGRELTQEEGKKAKTAFEVDKEKLESELGEDFFRQTFEDFRVAQEAEMLEINSLYAQGELSFDEMRKDTMENAVKRALFFSRRVKDVDDPEERLEINREIADAFDDYKDNVLNLSTEELEAQEEIHKNELDNATTELERRKNNITELDTKYNDFIANLNARFEQPADHFLQTMSLSIDQANFLLQQSSVQLAQKMGANYRDLKSNLTDLNNEINDAETALQVKSDQISQDIFDSQSNIQVLEAEIESPGSSVAALQDPAEEQGFWEGAGEFIGDVASNVGDFFGDVASGVGDFVQGAAEGIWSGITNIGSGIAGLFGFAEGGVANSLGFVGEKGPEAILTGRQMKNAYDFVLSNTGSGGATNNSPVININILNPVVREDSDITNMSDTIQENILRTFQKLPN